MPDAEVTQLLARFSQGDPEAVEGLLSVVYQELRGIAGNYMRRESKAHTLQPTALVHEAYLKLIGQNEVDWQNRAHFFGVAAQMMRRLLIDHARKKKAEKRGGELCDISFEEGIHGKVESPDDLLALDRALKQLAEKDERQAKIVELKYFGGLSIEEIAQLTGTSKATVKRDWAVARAWLHRELTR